MRNWTIKLAVVIFLISAISLFYTSYTLPPAYAVPRNLIIGEGGGGNYTITNQTIPDNVLYLLQRLEELKNIVSKYNSTLAGKINDIQLELLSGDLLDARRKYMSIENDLETLSKLLKNIDPEEYSKLIDILNEDLVNYMYSNQDGADLGKIFTTNMDISNIEPGSIDVPSTGESPLNPTTTEFNIPTLPTPSIPSIDSNYLYWLVGISLTITALYLLRDRRIRQKISSGMMKIGRVMAIKKTGKIIAKDPVVRTYYQFLNKCEEIGESKKDYEGPLEHVYRLRNSRLKEVGIKIATIFEKIRYGNKRISETEEREVSEIFMQLTGEGKSKIDQ